MTVVSKKNAPVKKDEEFRLLVKTVLLREDMTVAELARRIRRPRPTVSTAINHARFRGIRREILKELKLA